MNSEDRSNVQDETPRPARCIGWAVDMLRNEKKVARTGWNGKGMFLFFSPGFKPGGDFLIHYAGFRTHEFRPYVAMKTADGACVPWVCSQSDLLADDWEEVQVG